MACLAVSRSQWIYPRKRVIDKLVIFFLGSLWYADGSLGALVGPLMFVASVFALTEAARKVLGEKGGAAP